VFWQHETGSKKAFPAQWNESETYFFGLVYQKTQARAETRHAWRLCFQSAVQLQGMSLSPPVMAKSSQII
jgi:hypothetical protein